ncbi:MAG: methionyl-tRNA formyltransferase [Synergistaceae bacterium]|jgi:methionyl-tRNA formyltransferase|nr:methionyl-tRNA formyltransferase [Synergistaceae bacterium]
MRFWFLGSGSFAALCLASMVRKFFFERIITGKPTLAGRGLKETPSCVEETAARLGLISERTGPLSQNENLITAITTNPPDVLFVIDFGQLIREPLLSAPRYGCLNIHPSLLPRWRGAAPVPRALMNGDSTTGVTLFRLTEAMDAGPVIRQIEIPIGLEATSADLYEILAREGSQTAYDGVQCLIEGSCQISAQNSEFATQATKISKTEFQISWQQNSLDIHNTVRALVSSRGAFVVVNNMRLKVWRTLPVEPPSEGTPGQVVSFMEGDPVVLCGKGALRLQEVQCEGKRRVTGAEWACGVRLKTGEVLS